MIIKAQNGHFYNREQALKLYIGRSAFKYTVLYETDSNIFTLGEYQFKETAERILNNIITHPAYASIDKDGVTLNQNYTYEETYNMPVDQAIAAPEKEKEEN